MTSYHQLLWASLPRLLFRVGACGRSQGTCTTLRDRIHAPFLSQNTLRQYPRIPTERKHTSAWSAESPSALGPIKAFTQE